MAVISESPIDGSVQRPVDLAAQALRDPPIWDKKVLQLGLSWPDVADREPTEGWRWAAERLSVFVLTWDPFEWLADRPAAFATSARRPEGVGVVLYLPHWEALALAGDGVAGVGSVVGQLAESVLSVAGEAQASLLGGTFAEEVHAASRDALLSRIPDHPALPEPELSIVGPGWRDVEYDVLEDLAQDAFGPAELDHSPVRFTEKGEGLARCPGCAGRTLDFPDGLQGVQDDMCGPHRGEALAITATRLDAARSSNPAGWEALLDAGQRLGEPHLPNGLGPRLLAAAAAHERPVRLGHEVVRDQAALIVEAARVLRGLPEPASTLGERLAPVRPWLDRFAGLLAGEVPTDELVRVSEAITVLRDNPLGGATPAAAKPAPFRREVRVGRNEPCPCGSGKKYKFCHG